jgi:transcriptional regulator with XRE-family HTH domain
MTEGAAHNQAGAVLQAARMKAGVTQRQLAAAAGTFQATIACYEAGSVVPDLRTVARLVEAYGFDVVPDLEPQQPAGRTGRKSAVMRPPAIPDDFEDPSIEKASDVVELPLRVQWSGRRSYDLSDRQDRAPVYELVLREGTEDGASYGETTSKSSGATSSCPRTFAPLGSAGSLSAGPADADPAPEVGSPSSPPSCPSAQ